MLIIDQTEAKYRWQDIFFIDKANEDPPPYKIGDEQFWEEAGNEWKKQLKQYKNIPKRKREEWKPLAKRRMRESKKKAKQKLEEDEDGGKWETNQISLAEPEQIEMHQKEIAKRYNIGKSCIEQAREKISQHKIFKYKPTEISNQITYAL